MSFSKEAAEALAALETHRDQLVRDAAEAIKESHARRQRILKLVQEALQQLRLDMKYLMFDLEATRRERDALQEQAGK